MNKVADFVDETEYNEIIVTLFGIDREKELYEKKLLTRNDIELIKRRYEKTCGMA